MPLLYPSLSFFSVPSLTHSLGGSLLFCRSLGATGNQQSHRWEVKDVLCLGYVLRSNGLIWSNLEHTDVKPAGSTMIFSS